VVISAINTYGIVQSSVLFSAIQFICQLLLFVCYWYQISSLYCAKKTGLFKSF